ncbi:MAG: RIP metalloprotease RseP [Bacteroidia bacterium]|nr:RIP metalloprotease RseP [Bacteroidia bacterium]
MWITITQFFLSLSILIVLHELGHFSAAKWFKTRVEKFYLFFNPGFALFKIQKGETEYGIGWLPFGGYVKISGMIDESFDKDQMQGEPQPWEFRAKPAWQRLIIMVGGVTVNFILGIFIFSMLFWQYGESYFPPSEIKDGISVDSFAYEMGLRDGDHILKVGDRVFDKFNSAIISKELIINEASEILVSRDGNELTINVDPRFKQELTKYANRNIQLIGPRIPYIVGEIRKNSPAEDSGIQIDDQVIALNGQEARFAHEFVKAKNAFEGNDLELTILRESDTLINRVPLDENGMIGLMPYNLDHYVQPQKEKYTFLESIPAGWNKSWTFLTDQIKAFGQMFQGKIKAKDSLGSFITIGKMFGTNWDWERFWSMTAMLSILLGFINLLPIPALDGGYVMFLLFESITGIKVPDRVMEIATFTGFVLLIILMIYALGLDISRLF